MQPDAFPHRHAFDVGRLSVIPLSLIHPHELQALRNHSQTLARLAERGGLSPCEAVAVLQNRRWQPMTEGRARLTLARMVFTHVTGEL